MSSPYKAASHWDNLYSRNKAPTWHTDPQLSQYIERRQFGKPGHWLGHIFSEVITSRPRRLLSLACGSGDHEIAIARNGLADYVEAFDVSQVGIEKASTIVLQEKLNASFYVESFGGFVSRRYNELFDAVMFVGSLHHVENLNDVLNKVREILSPDGFVIYNEYIGPCYITFPDQRVDLLNRLLLSIPAEFKLTPDVQWRNPTIDEVFNTDPTESVRSSLIPQFLRLYFDVVWERPFGGGILHPIYQLLDTERLKAGDLAATTLLSLLSCFEEVMESTPILTSDFVLGVARQKR